MSLFLFRRGSWTTLLPGWLHAQPAPRLTQNAAETPRRRFRFLRSELRNGPVDAVQADGYTESSATAICVEGVQKYHAPTGDPPGLGVGEVVAVGESRGVIPDADVVRSPRARDVAGLARAVRRSEDQKVTLVVDTEQGIFMHIDQIASCPTAPFHLDWR